MQSGDSVPAGQPSPKDDKTKKSKAPDDIFVAWDADVANAYVKIGKSKVWATSVDTVEGADFPMAIFPKSVASKPLEVTGISCDGLKDLRRSSTAARGNSNLYDAEFEEGTRIVVGMKKDHTLLCAMYKVVKKSKALICMVSVRAFGAEDEDTSITTLLGTGHECCLGLMRQGGPFVEPPLRIDSDNAHGLGKAM